MHVSLLGMNSTLVLGLKEVAGQLRPPPEAEGHTVFVTSALGSSSDAIFFTPVLYPASMLGKWQNIVMLNPIAPLLEGISNSIVLAQAPDVRWTSYSVVATILLLMGGYWLFKQLESRFAESI